ncbi:MAG: hypothetical protein M3Q42_09830 [Pseudomonadota bacterium]|nr:hypothetical protein [Pseudomonadota bacterium]
MTLVEAEPSPHAALAAFLRGLERRAAVLAELHAGDAAAGDAAVAATMIAWRAHASGLAMGDWPVAFWSALLAQPQMRTRTPVAMCLHSSDNLGELAFEPRAALLLRLAAGLEERAAAAAMGISEGDYLDALEQAVPRQSDGSPDLQAWRGLQDEIHSRTRTLPPPRLLYLSSAREAALRAPSAPFEGTAAKATRPRRHQSPLLIALWMLLIACALALTASFLPAAGDWLDRYQGLDRRGGELPEGPAASYYSPEAGLVAHPDFTLLADPDSSNAMDFAFHSWLAAQPAGFVDDARPLLTTSEPQSQEYPSAAAAGESRRATSESDDADI